MMRVAAGVVGASFAVLYIAVSLAVPVVVVCVAVHFIRRFW